MNRITLTALTLLTASGLVACKGTKEIDDPGMQETGKAVGSSSGTMSQTPDDADDSTIQTNVQGVGSNFTTLVSQHQSYAAANSADGGEADFATLARASGDVVDWDGSHMLLDITLGEEGFESTYDVDLTMGSGPSTIDGKFDFDYTLGIAGISSTYNIHATYDELTYDDAGCAVSGSVSLDWSFDASVSGLGLPGAAGASADKGTVVTEFTACDTVVISGT